MDSTKRSLQQLLCRLYDGEEFNCFIQKFKENNIIHLKIMFLENEYVIFINGEVVKKISNLSIKLKRIHESLIFINVCDYSFNSHMLFFSGKDDGGFFATDFFLDISVSDTGHNELLIIPEEYTEKEIFDFIPLLDQPEKYLQAVNLCL